MSSIMWWEKARAGWRPEGHVLEIPHELRDREAIRFTHLLQSRWRSLDLNVIVRAWKEPHAGSLEITGTALLDVEPQQLRSDIAACATQARTEIEAARAAEEPVLTALVEVIRGQRYD